MIQTRRSQKTTLNMELNFIVTEFILFINYHSNLWHLGQYPKSIQIELYLVDEREKKYKGQKGFKRSQSRDVCIGNNIQSLLVLSPVNTKYLTLHAHPY